MEWEELEKVYEEEKWGGGEGKEGKVLVEKNVSKNIFAYISFCPELLGKKKNTQFHF